MPRLLLCLHRWSARNYKEQNFLSIINMEAKNIRKAFLSFFESKKHLIVPSAPMVVKNDPTLMFTNAGMNQFKDAFLGNEDAKAPRIADSQKCLRVSGKHNDLEEVGHDTYHHTMFEMLGNWSFGDYFKQEAIDWAWEFLTKELDIEPENLYVTVFEGDEADGTEFDQEAAGLWRKHVPEDRVLKGNKKDNFWEMGDTGPCGPCSEIHVDIRSADDKKNVSGRDLVNMDHPQVIEIWNLVFIQYNRKASGELELLSAKHVDTGMGFERLCMVVQGKQSNYDTDVFQPIIKQIGAFAGKKYGDEEKVDIAMRVISDHLRTIAFAIADGQLPSNNKAGYVIRRILRRSVRYGYTFLGFNDPFMYKLLPVLNETMADAYPELLSQAELISKVMFEEEASFLRTLETGIKLLDKVMQKAKSANESAISGEDAFVLYDTFGFPFDLTQLILRESNMTVDETAFAAELEKQKNRSRQATETKTDDWQSVNDIEPVGFVGYDHSEVPVKIIRYRKIVQKKKELYQLVLSQTPFYAESGGQLGDTGVLISGSDTVQIIDTQKENNLTVHIATKLPADCSIEFEAKVDVGRRSLIMANHSATHLLHKALQEVLGSHVEQKGSLVGPEYLRFDFSHFQKMSDDEIKEVEAKVNAEIRQNISLNEKRSIPIAEAQAMGAKALFGEKYGDEVRVVQFGDSIELCGGTHVQATGAIGFFKIISEGAISAGVRRIEAISSAKAESYVQSQLDELGEIRAILKSGKDTLKKLQALVEENSKLQKSIEALNRDKVKNMIDSLVGAAEEINGVTFIGARLDVDNAGLVKDIAFLLKERVDNLFFVGGADVNGKANLGIMISDNVVNEKGLHAGNIIRTVAKEIQGGGGGQPFFASAGGNKPEGIENAIAQAKALL